MKKAINGKQVVSSLNTDDLESSRKHPSYFQAGQMATGRYLYISMIMAAAALGFTFEAGREVGWL